MAQKQFSYRMSETFHRLIQQLAKEDGRSMQMWVQRTIEKAIGEKRIADFTLQELKGKKK